MSLIRPLNARNKVPAKQRNTALVRMKLSALFTMLLTSKHYSKCKQSEAGPTVAVRACNSAQLKYRERERQRKKNKIIHPAGVSPGSKTLNKRLKRASLFDSANYTSEQLKRSQ